MAKKKKGTFSNARNAVKNALRDLERAVMGMVSAPAKPSSAKAKTARPRTAKKAKRKQ